MRMFVYCKILATKKMNLQKFYSRLGRNPNDLGIKIRKQDVLYDEKWKIFLRRAKMFRYIPFVEFVFAAGSMALGNVNENSDFDVIVGAKENRLYTTRFISVLAFGALKMRRRKLTHHEHAKNKICLNHFVTLKSAKLSPPYNFYWQELYQNLVPLYGNEEAINSFWEANNWVGKPKHTTLDLRYINKHSKFKITIEKALSGSFGNFVENKLRSIQVKRINKNFIQNKGFEPRIKVTRDELEFHPDTKRTEEFG